MKWIENGLYVADLMVRMAYHSTAIEGNTLTLGDSRSILINGIVPAKAKPLREIFEIANYKNLLPFLREQVEGAITFPLIQNVHQILLQNIDPRSGQFKVSENMILGASFLPVHSSQVIPSLIRWCDRLEYRLKQAASDEEKVKILMAAHIKFEKIHPFADGNGRTGRALIIFSCAREGLIPIVIEKEQRNEYIALLNNEDVKGLSEMAHTLQEKERVRLERADQMMEEKDDDQD